MYYTYKKEKHDGKKHFHRLEKISIAGCNVGIVANYFKKTLNKSANQPIGWTIEIGDLFNELWLEGNTIIIDMKPNSEKEILLLELIRIHGYSHCGWTPILLETQEVLIDEPIEKYNKEDFILEEPQPKGIGALFLYLSGTIKEGNLVGKWVFAPPSSTNSAWLTGEPLDFLLNKIGYRKTSHKPFRIFEDI